MYRTRFKTQQFSWGFRTYDTKTEESVDGSIETFDVLIDDAKIIQDGGAIEIIDNEVNVVEELSNQQSDELTESETT